MITTHNALIKEKTHEFKVLQSEMANVIIATTNGFTLFRNGLPIAPTITGQLVYSGNLSQGEYKIVSNSKPFHLTVSIFEDLSHEEGGGEKLLEEEISFENMNMVDQIRAEVLSALSVQSDANNRDTFEEANDLDFEDDFDDLPNTPYIELDEEEFTPPETEDNTEKKSATKSEDPDLSDAEKNSSENPPADSVSESE